MLKCEYKNYNLQGGLKMTAINITNERQNLYQLVRELNENHEPVTVINNKDENNIVMISEQDWNDIQETLYLYSIPEMVQSIKEGMNESIEDGYTLEEVFGDV